MAKTKEDFGTTQAPWSAPKGEVKACYLKAPTASSSPRAGTGQADSKPSQVQRIHVEPSSPRNNESH